MAKEQAIIAAGSLPQGAMKASLSGAVDFHPGKPRLTFTKDRPSEYLVLPAHTHSKASLPPPLFSHHLRRLILGSAVSGSSGGVTVGRGGRGGVLEYYLCWYRRTSISGTKKNTDNLPA
jgi:hypothetical protein